MSFCGQVGGFWLRSQFFSVYSYVFSVYTEKARIYILCVSKILIINYGSTLLVHWNGETFYCLCYVKCLSFIKMQNALTLVRSFIRGQGWNKWNKCMSQSITINNKCTNSSKRNFDKNKNCFTTLAALLLLYRLNISSIDFGSSQVVG